MKHLTKTHLFLILISAVILTSIGVATFVASRPATPAPVAKPVEAEKKVETDEPEVQQSTLPGKKEYELIETDMSVEDAKKLLGEPSSETAYESQGRKNSTIMFNGKGDFGAYIMVTTSDGKIKSKSQFGLK